MLGLPAAICRIFTIYVPGFLLSPLTFHPHDRLFAVGT